MKFDPLIKLAHPIKNERHNFNRVINNSMDSNSTSKNVSIEKK